MFINYRLSLSNIYSSVTLRLTSYRIIYDKVPNTVMTL